MGSKVKTRPKNNYSRHTKKKSPGLPVWGKVVCYYLLPFVVVMGGVVGGVLASWQTLSRLSYFQIHHVNIQGALEHLDRERLEASLRTELEKGFLALSVDALRQAASVSPWVQAVSVERSWPDEINITLQTWKPLAVWNHTTVMTPSGYAFNLPQTDVPPGLVQVVSQPEDFELVKSELPIIGAALVKAGVQLKAVSYNSDSGWQLTLASGVQVILGEKELDLRLRRLQFLLSQSQLYAEGPVAMDLRYTNGVAVRKI